jgi:hypothetical protein
MADVTDSKREPFVFVDAKKLRDAQFSELALRFAFGAAASLIAGLVSIAFGPRLGGVFLAFPAILPASLTLIEKKENLTEATQNVIGAVLGALGLLAFAVVGGGALKRYAIGIALSCALAAWLAVSVIGYVVLELTRRRAETSQ